MTDIRVFEVCTCGAEFEAEGPRYMVQEAIDQWYDRHRHEEVEREPDNLETLLGVAYPEIEEDAQNE